MSAAKIWRSSIARRNSFVGTLERLGGGSRLQFFVFRSPRSPPGRSKDQADHHQRKQRDLNADVVPARNDAEPCHCSNERGHDDRGQENPPGHATSVRFRS